MDDNTNGKIIVITGASSGLGRAAALHLARAGARVVLGARRAERIEALAETIRGEGGEAIAQLTDVTRHREVEALVATAVREFGRVDVMINNAGVMPQSALDQLLVEEWDRMIDVNIKGVLYGIAAALPHMQSQKSGHIINVSSVAGHKVRAGGVVYAATKHAVRVLTEGLRQEVKPYNIRTTVISPGAVESELPATISDPIVAARTLQFYQEFAISPESFARAASFAINQPDDMDVNEILFRPTAQDF